MWFALPRVIGSGVTMPDQAVTGDRPRNRGEPRSPVDAEPGRQPVRQVGHVLLLDRAPRHLEGQPVIAARGTCARVVHLVRRTLRQGTPVAKYPLPNVHSDSRSRSSAAS
jgi:hypothetical protein